MPYLSLRKGSPSTVDRSLLHPPPTNRGLIPASKDGHIIFNRRAQLCYYFPIPNKDSKIRTDRVSVLGGIECHGLVYSARILGVYRTFLSINETRLTIIFQSSIGHSFLRKTKNSIPGLNFTKLRKQRIFITNFLPLTSQLLYNLSRASESSEIGVSGTKPRPSHQ
jgi:hypothetical protein